MIAQNGGATVEQTIYADILFAVNFSMDFLALYVTDHILKLRFDFKRCIVAAIVGALYGVLAVALDMGTVCGLLSTVAVGIFMCLILNGFKGFGMVARETAVFVSANLLIGGGMTAVYEYFNAHGGADNILIYGKAETVEEQLPMALFIAASIVVTVIVFGFSRGIARHSRAKRIELIIEHNGKKLKTTALQDSGNLLTEPISGLPVIILRKEAAGRILEQQTVDLLSELTAAEKSGEKVRFILYETVSGKGLMGAFKPQKILINGVSVDGWVAISDKLSKKISGVDEAIVPAALVN